MNTKSMNSRFTNPLTGSTRKSLLTGFLIVPLLLVGTLLGAQTAIAAPAVVHNQCQPGPEVAPNGIGSDCIENSNPNGWKSGLNAGPFNQGDSIPYRALMTDTVVGVQYTLKIEYDVSKAGEHALDFVTTFNRTMTNADACSDHGDAAICADVDTFTVPIDPQVTAGPDGLTSTADDITQVSGDFTLYGGTIDNVFYSGGDVLGDGSGTPYDFSGDKRREITVVYTIDQLSTNKIGPVLTWGGHIARNMEWINANPQGSPYHMRFNAWTCETGDCSSGQQDMALNSAAVRSTDLSITKTDDVDPIVQGGTLTYTVTVTNNGPDDAVSLVVTDTLPAGVTYISDTGNCTESPTDTLTCPLGDLPAAAGSNTISFNIVVTVDGSTLGIIINTATVVADTLETDLTNNTATEDTLVIVPPTGSLTITKTVDADTSGFTSGDFGVRADCTTDPNSPYTRTISYPAPGDVTIAGIPTSSVCTVTETSTPTAPAGWEWATPTISGPATIPSGGTATVTVANMLLSQHLAITKDATEQSYSAVGDILSYTIVATNDGTATLASVTVSDPLVSNLTCDPTNGSTLAPTESMTCTATHTVTQADIDAGHWANTACADDGVDGAAEVCDDEDVPADQNPELSITKVATETIYDSVGDVLNYTIVATNIGNTTLASVTVTDPDVSDLSCTPTNGSSLAPAATMDCTATHTVTQADIDAGHWANTACADDGVDGAAEVCDDEDVPADQNPELSITKVATETIYDSVGDVLNYTIVATNIGNTTLASVTVTDPDVSDLSCTPTNGSSLAPAATMDCTATHTVTQADIDAGHWANTACADDGVDGAAEVCDDEDVPADQNPELSITKVATETIYDSVGDVLNYTIVATNIGNTTLASVTVTDPDVSDLSCTPTNGSSLAPAATMDCTATHTVTQADIDAGHWANTACADDGVDGAAEVCDDEDVPADQNPELFLVKSTTTMLFSAVGDTIDYSYDVTNIGNVTLAGPVTISDNKTTATCADLTTIGDDDSDLDVGETVICTAVDYVVTQADIDFGSVTNLATASADGTTSNEDSVTVSKATSMIAPTQTTCQMYRDGTAENYEMLQYNPFKKTSTVGSVNPGVIFYWTTVTAPDSGEWLLEAAESNTVSTGDPWRDMGTLDVFLWDGNCDKVQTTTLAYADDGDPRLTITDYEPGVTYYFSVKYDTSSLSGQPIVKVQGAWPSATYTIETWLGGELEGTLIATSPDSVTIVPKK